MARLTGRPSPIETIGAVLREDFRKKSKKAEFTACNLRLENGVFYVDFDGKKSGTSAILTNMLGDTALLYTTEDEGDKKAGEMVKVVRL
jgi:molybdopterin molybdotransferase